MDETRLGAAKTTLSFFLGRVHVTNITFLSNQQSAGAKRWPFSADTKVDEPGGRQLAAMHGR